MRDVQPFSAVLRLGDVSLSKEAIESALSASLERYEPQRNGPLYYAQVAIAYDADAWLAIVAHMREIGPAVARLVAEGAIGDAMLDLAFEFSAERATLFVRIPSAAAHAAGACGIEIEASIYPTD